MPALQDMIVLYGSMHTILPFNAGLRSGDLMILFAASWHELEKLIAMQDVFESFRVILILGSNDFRRGHSYYQLKPRFTTALDSDLPDLEAVVGKMVLAF